MATRSRVAPTTPTHPQTILERDYEEFKPRSEWNHQDESDFLIMNLPGFREFIKVTIENQKILRVRGERPIAGSKWSRFQEDFNIPENCDTSGIRAKYDGGILTISMPKGGKAPSAGARADVPSNREDIKQEDKSMASPREKLGNSTPQQMPTPEVREEVPSGPPKTDDIHPTVMGGNDSKTGVSKILPEVRGMEKPQEKKGNEKEQKPSKQDTLQNKDQRKTVNEGKEPKKADINIVEKIAAKKVKDMRDSTDHVKTIGGHSLAKKINEDRELLVNMGVAVLVIVALGAYVSYTYGSARKAND